MQSQNSKALIHCSAIVCAQKSHDRTDTFLKLFTPFDLNELSKLAIHFFASNSVWIHERRKIILTNTAKNHQTKPGVRWSNHSSNRKCTQFSTILNDVTGTNGSRPKYTLSLPDRSVLPPDPALAFSSTSEENIHVGMETSSDQKKTERKSSYFDANHHRALAPDSFGAQRSRSAIIFIQRRRRGFWPKRKTH